MSDDKSDDDSDSKLKSDSVFDLVLRLRKLTAKLKENPEAVEFAQAHSQAASTEAARADKAAWSGERTAAASRKVDEFKCRAEFARLMAKHPQWSYTKLSDFVGAQFGVTGRAIRNIIPDTDPSAPPGK